MRTTSRLIILLFALNMSLLSFLATTTFAQQTRPGSNMFDAYAPFMEVVQITPSDVTTYSPPLRGCIVEAEGDLAIFPVENVSAVTITVFEGQLIPAQISKVMSTGTTATVVCGR